MKKKKKTKTEQYEFERLFHIIIEQDIQLSITNIIQISVIPVFELNIV